MTDEKSDLYEEFIDNVSEKMCDDLLIETIGKLIIDNYFMIGNYYNRP